jgi:hypothetical protein
MRAPARRVSFSAPAMTAERLLPALSARAGVRLECAPETRGEVLLLHVRSAPLSEVMDRIAEAASARWVPARGGFRLVRPAEMDRTQRRREIEERARWLRRSLTGITAGLDQPLEPAQLVASAHYREDLDETGRMMPSAVIWMDPAFRLLARCLREIGPEQLAAIPLQRRVVWATDPTPMQRPLGAPARAALQLLGPEQRIFGETLKSANVAPGFEEEMLPHFPDF